MCFCLIFFGEIFKYLELLFVQQTDKSSGRCVHHTIKWKIFKPEYSLPLMILWWNISGNEVLLTHQFAEYLYVIFSNTNSQDGVLIDPVLHLEPHLWKLHLFRLSVFFSQSELEAQIPRHLGAKIIKPISHPTWPPYIRLQCHFCSL